MRALLAHPRLPWLAVLLAVALCLPALGAGFFSDDWMHRAVLLGAGPFPASAHPLMDLFAFVGPRAPFQSAWESGDLAPWWAAPDLSLSLWRPVTALTHLLDARAWPAGAILPHLHSLAWLGLAVGLAAALFRRVEGGAVAALATLLFAVEDAHAIPAAWVANRNALVCLVLGLGALLCHRRWRLSGRRADLCAASACFGLGLFAGEAALGALAYLVAFQVCLDSGPWRRRLFGLAPYLALVIAWRAAYRGLAYGVVGSGLYVDPAREPLPFLAALLERGPLLLAGQWLQAPLDAWVMLPRSLQVVAAGAGAAVGVGLLLYALPLLARRPEARFWALGMALSVVPLCATFPMDRLLGFTGLGAAGLLAGLARATGWLGSPALFAASRARRVVLALLLALHGPLAAPLLALKAGTALRWMAPMDGLTEKIAAIPGIEERTLVLVNGHDLLQIGLAFTLMGQDLPGPRRMLQLGTITTPLDVARVDERTLEVAQEGGLFAMAFDRLCRRPDRPARVGERFAVPDASIEILAVTDKGWPRRWRVRFAAPLADPSYHFARLVFGDMEPWTPPPVGGRERIEIPALHRLTAR